jgi:hypothetical protein
LRLREPTSALALMSMPGWSKRGVSRSKRTVPAEAPAPQRTLCGPLMMVSRSKVSGAM